MHSIYSYIIIYAVMHTNLCVCCISICLAFLRAIFTTIITLCTSIHIVLMWDSILQSLVKFSTRSLASQDGVPPCGNEVFSLHCLLQPWRTQAWPRHGRLTVDSGGEIYIFLFYPAVGELRSYVQPYSLLHIPY